MTDSHLSFIQLSNVLEESERKLSEILDRRSKGLYSPTLQIERLEYDGMTFSKQYYDLVALIFVSWYSDYFQEFAGYLRFEVENYLNKNCIFPELNASLVSKEILLPVLMFYSKVKNTNILFGTVLTEERINRVLDVVSLRIVKRGTSRRPVRRRGYKDHGSKRPDHTWLPSSDYSLNSLQKEIEAKRESYHEEVSSIVRTVGGLILTRLNNFKEDE